MDMVLVRAGLEQMEDGICDPVLDDKSDDDCPSRPQDAVDLPKGGAQVRDMVQDADTGHALEHPVRKGKMKNIRVEELGLESMTRQDFFDLAALAVLVDAVQLPAPFGQLQKEDAAAVAHIQEGVIHLPLEEAHAHLQSLEIEPLHERHAVAAEGVLDGVDFHEFKRVQEIEFHAVSLPRSLFTAECLFSANNQSVL
jgi:hypothetical protein